MQKMDMHYEQCDKLNWFHISNSGLCYEFVGGWEREDDGVGSSFPVFKIFFFQFSTVQFNFININWAFDVTIHRVNKPEDRSWCQSHRGGYWKQQYRKIYPSLLFLPCFLFSFLSFLPSFFLFFYTPQLYWDMIDI